MNVFFYYESKFQTFFFFFWRGVRVWGWGGGLVYVIFFFAKSPNLIKEKKILEGGGWRLGVVG